jgi:inward rectifier potassium channel
MIQRMASQPKGGTPPPVMTSSPTGTFYTEDRYFGDVYHHLLTSSWPALLLQIAGAFALANAFFALAYLLDGGIANARHGSFADVFFFSVETMATIGYGQMSPVSFISHVLMSIEALTGLISIALITGLIFAKFSRPTARVRFTRVAVISKRDGLPSLMFRMANVRSNQIVEAQIHVVLARQEFTVEGEEVRRFHDLSLSRHRNAIFEYSWTAIHQIDTESPLFGATPESLFETRAGVIVSLTGIDETFSQTIYARHTYGAIDIVWGARLADITTHTPAGKFALDMSRFDEIGPAEMPVWDKQTAAAD